MDTIIDQLSTTNKRLYIDSVESIQKKIEEIKEKLEAVEGDDEIAQLKREMYPKEIETLEKVLETTKNQFKMDEKIVSDLREMTSTEYNLNFLENLVNPSPEIQAITYILRNMNRSK
jgi:predicted  nucleic acid-binding Zn-ribbon protein